MEMCWSEITNYAWFMLIEHALKRSFANTFWEILIEYKCVVDMCFVILVQEYKWI